MMTPRLSRHKAIVWLSFSRSLRRVRKYAYCHRRAAPHDVTANRRN